MKKKFVKVSLFCALAATASTAFVACADYDDDIKNLQEQVDANKTLAETLDAQIQDLKKAQETANAEIQAAKDAAAAAQEAADKANELAKQAAAEAKAEAIEEATKLVEALKADIEAKNYATTEDLNAAITTVNSKIASIEEGLNGKIDGINTTIKGLEGRVSKTEELIEELKTQKLAVETFEQYKKDAALEIDSLDEKIDSVKTALEKAITDAEKKAQEAADAAEDAANVYTDQEIKALRADLEKQISEVSSNLVTLLGESLRSLVFVPDLYVDGIEAAEYDYLPYKEFKTANTPATNLETDEKDAAEIKGIYGGGSYDYAIDPTDPNVYYINPMLEVSYKMNPSSAVIDDNALAFIEREVEVVSRATSSGKISFKKVVDKSNGILKVGLEAEGVQISSQSNKALETQWPQVGDAENDATIFALQSTKKGDGTAENPDQTVTSDYAMLYASALRLRAIAYNDGVTGTTEIAGENDACDLPLINGNLTPELYVTPSSAIKNVATVRIQYTQTSESTALDLASLIQLHYDWYSNTHNNGKCKILTLADAEKKYGLTVKFNRVNYEVGASKTADSQYLKLTPDGKATVCSVNAAGEQENNSNPVSAIGRHPLVQVLVYAGNKIVLDGYIKLEIVREIVNKETACFDFGNVAFGCTQIAKTLTWSQIADQLLQNAAVTSREEFDALYTIEMDGNEIAQYVRAGDYTEAKPTYTKLTNNKVGVVTENKDGLEGTTTTLLTWTIGAPCPLQAIYESTADAGERGIAIESKKDYTTQTAHAKTIYVKYVNKSNTDQSKEYPGIYLPLTIGVDKPQATIGGKNSNYWFMNDTQIRVGANAPIQGTFLGADGITKTLAEVWNTNKPAFEGLDRDYFTAYKNVDVLNGVDGGFNYYFRPENQNVQVEGATITDWAKGTHKIYTLSVEKLKATDQCDGKADYEVSTESELANALDVNDGAYTNIVIKATNGGQTMDIVKLVNGVLEYQYNDFSKDILNRYGHDEQNVDPAKAFNVLLGIYGYTDCGKAPADCEIALSLKNNTFNAMFQRPVDIEGAEEQKFIDALEDGDELDIIKAFNFSDWRGRAFIEGADISYAWLFGYYGFTKAEMLRDQVTTTLGMSDAEAVKQENLDKNVLLNTIDPSKGVDLVQNGAAFNISNPVASNNTGIYDKVNKGFSTIQYFNNNANVKPFWFRIPVKFYYSWGEIVATVDVYVEGTMGN